MWAGQESCCSLSDHHTFQSQLSNRLIQTDSDCRLLWVCFVLGFFGCFFVCCFIYLFVCLVFVCFFPGCLNLPMHI